MSSERRPYELKARAERQLETRRRIVDATVALHEEVGPARTTVAEIARRAGVTRLTVYNHFPEDAELFAACQGEFLARNPLPDLSPALALPDPRERVRVVLCGLYAGYRERAPMTSKVLRDRSAIPALDELLARTADVQMAGLAGTLAAGFGVDDEAAATRVRAVVALALDFWTWARLTGEGLGDDEAAQLMAGLAASCPPGEAHLVVEDS